MNDNQEEFISWLAGKLDAADEGDLKNKLEELGDDGIKQAYDQFLQDMVSVKREGGRIDYIKCLQAFKKGGKTGCGCSGMTLKLSKDKGGKLERSFNGKAVKGLNPKKVIMGQGADGVLGGRPALKRQQGGVVNTLITDNFRVDSPLATSPIVNQGVAIAPTISLSQRLQQAAQKFLLAKQAPAPVPVQLGATTPLAGQPNPLGTLAIPKVGQMNQEQQVPQQAVQQGQQLPSPAAKQFQQGGKLQSQPKAGAPTTGGNVMQPLTPEQVQEQKVDKKVMEIEGKKGPRDILTPMDILMEQVRPKQIKAKPEKEIKIYIKNDRMFGQEV